MRKLVAPRAAVRAATIGCAATVFLAPLLATTPALADPAAPTQLTAENLPAELVQAISRDLKMTPAEYLERSARAQQLSNYARDFRSERPDAFAGAWIGADGRPI